MTPTVRSGEEFASKMVYALLPMVTEKENVLTVRQLMLMLTLHMQVVPATVKDMAVALNVPKSAITRGANRLQQFQLVRRQENKEDRRLVLLVLTERGRRFVQGLDRNSTKLPLTLRTMAKRTARLSAT